MTVEMWTVYDHPSDHPDCFVARKWIVERGEPRPTKEFITAPTLDKLRNVFLDQHMTCFARDDFDDDPAIVETWIGS